MSTNVFDLGHKIVTEVLGASKERKPSVTVSQIRKFLSAVNAIQNKVSIVEEDKLSEELKNEIQYLRIKLAYQAGRNSKVKPLQENLDPIIQKIGDDKKRFLEFSRLIESIVAYHKYYGGE